MENKEVKLIKVERVEPWQEGGWEERELELPTFAQILFRLEGGLGGRPSEHRVQGRRI